VGRPQGSPHRFIRDDEEKPVRRAAPYRCIFFDPIETRSLFRRYLFVRRQKIRGEAGFSCAQSVFGAARGLPHRFIRGDEKKPVRRATPYRCATQWMNRCFLLRRRIPSRPFGKSRYACVLIPRRKS
jgi:hypothetical protein